MRKLFLLLAVMAATPASAGQKVLMLNEQEQQALFTALDDSTKFRGIAAAANNLHLLSKLQAAGTLAEEQPKPPAEPPMKALPEKHDNAQ